MAKKSTHDRDVFEEAQVLAWQANAKRLVKGMLVEIDEDELEPQWWCIVRWVGIMTTLIGDVSKEDAIAMFSEGMDDPAAKKQGEKIARQFTDQRGVSSDTIMGQKI